MFLIIQLFLKMYKPSNFPVAVSLTQDKGGL